MADEEYCAVEDVYAYGVPRGAFVHPAQAVSAVNLGSNTVTVADHGFRLGAALEPIAFDGGEIPAELAALGVVYARPVAGSDSQLELAATSDGPAIDLLEVGESWGLVPSLRETLRGFIRIFSRLVDQHLPAHAVPLEVDGNGVYPETVRYIVAVLAGEAALAAFSQSIATVTAAADRVRDTMAKMLRGIPLRDSKVTTSTNKALGSSPVPADRGYLP